MTAGCELEYPWFSSYGLAIFDSRFMKFVFRKGGGIKFWDPNWGIDTGGPNSITVRMEYLLAFQFWYC